MSSIPPHWRDWHNTSEEHSSKELEHRLTRLEVSSDDTAQQVDSHADRLNLHERAILGILGALYILLQDKFPKVAALLKELAR